MPKYKRRDSNNHKCDGSCGKPNCRFMIKGFKSKGDLNMQMGLNEFSAEDAVNKLTEAE